MGSPHPACPRALLVLRLGRGCRRKAPKCQPRRRTGRQGYPPATSSKVRRRAGFRLLFALGAVVSVGADEGSRAGLCALAGIMTFPLPHDLLWFLFLTPLHADVSILFRKEEPFPIH